MNFNGSVRVGKSGHARAIVVHRLDRWRGRGGDIHGNGDGCLRRGISSIVSRAKVSAWPALTIPGRIDRPNLPVTSAVPIATPLS